MWSDRPRAGAWALLALAPAAACAGERGPRRCGVDETFDVAVAVGAAFHGVALVDDGAGPRVAWSDEGGLHVRALGGDGAPEGVPVRLGPPCPGGIAGAAAGGRAWLACLDPGTPAAARAGWVRVYAADDGGAFAMVATHDGTGGLGVGLGATAERATVAWGDGGGVRVASPPSAEARLLPRAATFPGPPSVVDVAGEPLVVWSERWVDEVGVWGGVFGDRGRGAPHALADARSEESHAAATPHPDGGFVLAWRDLPEGWVTPRIFLRRFDARLRPMGEDVVRAARAESGGPVRLAPCFGDLVLTVPHRDGGASISLAVRRFDLGLAPRSAELSIYEQGTDFVEHDALCLGGQGPLLLALAERRRTMRRDPRLRTTVYRCR